MVADLSFPEFHLHLSTSAAFWESVAFMLQAVSQALCFLIAGARLTPGVPLRCLGQLVMYARSTELKVVGGCLLLLGAFPGWCRLSFVCHRMEQKED